MIGDFNGDGVQDVASATEGGIVLLFGNKAGSFTNSTIVNTGKAVVAAIAGDFNGDGKADALVQQGDGSLRTFFGVSLWKSFCGPFFHAWQFAPIYRQCHRRL